MINSFIDILNLLFIKNIIKIFYKAMTCDIIIEVTENNYDTKLCYKKGGRVIYEKKH